MAHWLRILAVAATCATSVSAQAQKPLGEVAGLVESEPQGHEVHINGGKSSGGLHGRFLHITGMLRAIFSLTNKALGGVVDMLTVTSLAHKRYTS